MSLRSGKLPSLGSEDEFFDHKVYSVGLLGTKTEIPGKPMYTTAWLLLS